MIDTHLHLSHRRFDRDRDQVLVRALDAGVRAAVEVGWDLASSAGAITLAGRYPDRLFPTAGIHPHEAEAAPADAMDQVAAMVDAASLVAIGETGLDFYRLLSPATVQEALFRAHIRLAQERRLPLVIHSRDATGRVLEILYLAGGNPAGGVLHCFSGNRAEALRATDELGLHLGVGGTLTYGDSELETAIAEAPADRLLLETDAPYLTPEPHRRDRNEPARLTTVRELLSTLRGTTPDAIDRATTANAIRLFRLPLAESQPEPAPPTALGESPIPDRA
jgi:TatD DNase family protein